MAPRPRTVALHLAVLGMLVSCSPATDDAGTSSPPSTTTAATAAAPTTGEPDAPSQTSTVPTTTAAPTTTAPAAPPATTAPAPHPVSMAALQRRVFTGGDLRLGDVLATTEAYTRYTVTYASGALTISGVLNVPTGDGPFPALVLAHGYIDPAVYRNGQGMPREHDYLARAGYVVLHTDYRNHAGSTDDPATELGLRLGYAEDVVNAVAALRASDLPVDPGRIGLMGRSMGGGVTYNALVARPGLVDAAVVHAPVSSSAGENFDRWTRAAPGADPTSDAIIAAYGTPEAAPDFWRAASPVSAFDRVRTPVLIQHGTADETCPPVWSEQTLAAMQAAGVDAELVTYEGEGHTFDAAWTAAMERTVAFFAEHLV